MGVYGDKVLEQETHEQTQDFIVISTNVFVTKDVEEFDQLIQASTGSALSKIRSFATHSRMTWNLTRSMKKFANPLQNRSLSGVNRARQVVYTVISTFRHQQNHAPRAEPTSSLI
jgi:hypothetical protein